MAQSLIPFPSTIHPRLFVLSTDILSGMAIGLKLDIESDLKGNMPRSVTLNVLWPAPKPAVAPTTTSSTSK